MLNYQRVVFLKNCVFSLLLWRHCLYYAMIYIYIYDMLCNSVRLHDLSWKPLLLQVEFHISEPETRPPHAVDVMLPPGTRDGQRNGLTTRLKVNNPAIWEYWIVAHGGCDAYVYHYYYCLRPHYYSLLWLFMSMFILVYHCLSSLWRLSPYYYVYSSMTVWPHYDHYYHIIYGCRKQLYQEPVNEVEGGLWGWLSWWNSHGSCHHQLSYFTTLWIRLSNHRISIDTCTVNRQKSRVTVLLHLQNDSAFKHSSQTAPVVPTVLHCNQRAAKPMSPCLVPNVRCDATRSCMATTQN